MDYFISTGTMDGYWRANLAEFNDSANFLLLGISAGVLRHSFFIYRPNIIPKSKILNANLIVSSYGNYTPILDISTRLYGVLQVNPLIPSTALECQNAPLTSSFSSWVFPASIPITIGTKYYSPSVTGLMQEIVNQPGYYSRSNIIIQLRTISASMLIGLRSYNFDINDAPILSISYIYKGKISISESIVKTIATGDRPIRP